ncbi:MAG: hypothetical protein LBH52_04025 [Puniceicoccales bacterium]|jgi:hypothetical protein|nr:hypothetical protein [Puniceicoccales bacterium]
MWLGLFKRLGRSRKSKDIGCFDACPTKYSTDRTFEPLQTIRLGKYESRRRENMRWVLKVTSIFLSSILGLWLLIESLRALLSF